MLAKHLEEKKFAVIDCQFHTEHLESMGGITVSRADYLKLLEQGIK